MKRQASVGRYYLYTMIIVFIMALVMSSCSTSHGCNFAKAQKYNQRQIRKSHRYN